MCPQSKENTWFYAASYISEKWGVLLAFFLRNYNEIHFRTEPNVENIKMLQRSETAIELCRLSAGDNWHRRLVYSFSTLRVSRMIFFSNTEHSELPKCK